MRVFSRLFFAALVAFTVSGCDSADDGSAFFQLQDTWERTDTGFTTQSVRFGPEQNYSFRDGDTVVERGQYVVLSGTPEATTFTVRYTADATAPPGGVGQPGGAPRPDETAQISGDTLVLTPPNGAARTYRRD